MNIINAYTCKAWFKRRILHAPNRIAKLNACKMRRLNQLRTFALIVCAQPFCAGNATAICHASLRLTGPEDKHGVENTGEKKFRPS